MFTDREDAGEQLGAHLADTIDPPDVILAIPRGGLPLGRAVADEFAVPLDVVIAKKLEAPANPELAIGAVSADGSVWYNDELIDRLDVTDEYIEDEREQQLAAAREKRNAYQDDDPPNLTDKAVLIVDDGVATGATALACLRTVDTQSPSRLQLAVPVGPPETLDTLRRESIVDAVIALSEPTRFGAVGAHYQHFDQVTDEEAIEYL